MFFNKYYRVITLLLYNILLYNKLLIFNIKLLILPTSLRSADKPYSTRQIAFCQDLFSFGDQSRLEKWISSPPFLQANKSPAQPLVSCRGLLGRVA